MTVSSNKIVIPGGSGFLGRCLSRWFAERGHEVVVLSRSMATSSYARIVLWDANSYGEWAKELEGAKAMINLTGRWVNCRYTKRNRREIMDSRLLSTRVLGEAVIRCDKPPAVWLNSSTATIYKHRYDKPNDEERGLIGSHPDAKDLFSVDVAESWEREFNAIQCPVTRKIIMRTSFIYGAEPGGVYETIRKLVLLRLGGKMGHGKQYVSWMHSDDFCQSIDWLIQNKNASGPYNLCTPNPLSNEMAMATIRRVLAVSIGFAPSRWMLELGAFVLRTETELIIKSRYIYPKRLVDGGYPFLYPELDKAIQQIEEELGKR